MQIVRTIKLLCARTVELLYLEAEHDRLERIVKTDQVATGAFGAVAAETNCFYNRSSTYSARKAITGLIDAARRAGRMLATKAQIARARIDPLNTTGSQLLTRYSRDAISRAHPIEAGIPISSPIRICRKAPRKTTKITLFRLAPMAMRTPISLVRRSTL